MKIRYLIKTAGAIGAALLHAAVGEPPHRRHGQLPYRELRHPRAILGSTTALLLALDIAVSAMVSPHLQLTGWTTAALAITVSAACWYLRNRISHAVNRWALDDRPISRKVASQHSSY